MPSPEPSVIRAVVERYVANWNAADPAALRQMFADGATIEDPIGTGVHEGLDAIEAQYGSAFGGVSGVLRLTGPIRVAESEAAFPLQVEIDLGKQIGTLPIIDTMTFDADAKITSMRAFCNAAELDITDR